MIRLALAAVLGLSLGCRLGREAGAGRDGTIVVRDAGLAPRAVVHEPDPDLFFVANVSGSAGYISVLSPEGEILALRWIDGGSDSVTLRAPKGLAVAGDFLSVADGATIRRFDRRTGVPRGEIAIPGATSLAGIAAGLDGALYFTDSGLQEGPGGAKPSGTDAVYRLRPDGTLDTLARGPGLGHPTAVAVSGPGGRGDSVWVVSGSGELYRVVEGTRADVVKLPADGLDGLVVVSGDAFVSSAQDGTVWRGPLRGPFRRVIRGLGGPAGIARDIWRHRLLIPLVRSQELRIVPLAP